MDEQMFKAWVQGTQAAKNEAWLWIWREFYAFAISTCKAMGGDAKTWAKEALEDAFLSVDKAVQEGRLLWKGEKLLLSFIWRVVFWRCMDKLRKWGRDQKRRQELIEVPCQPSQEKRYLTQVMLGVWIEMIEIILEKPERFVERQALHETIGKKREWFVERPVLHETISGMLQHLRNVFKNAIDDPGQADSPAKLSSLAREIDLEKLELRKPDLYQFLMTSLKIDRNTLDQRFKRIRAEAPEVLGPFWRGWWAWWEKK